MQSQGGAYCSDLIIKLQPCRRQALIMRLFAIGLRTAQPRRRQGLARPNDVDSAESIEAMIAVGDARSDLPPRPDLS
jgi:hypothetical protein